MSERAQRRVADEVAGSYDPAADGYDLGKDPRCLWGWGPPTAGCVHRMFGHTCFRALGHPGKCGDLEYPPDFPCDRHQRPKNWDASGRAEANR